MKSPYDVIIKPVLTEQSYEGMADRKYTFIVDRNANKTEIKQAIEAIFDDVAVSAVNVMNYSGKMRRMRSARYGKRSDWKKAVVTLKQGSIDML